MNRSDDMACLLGRLFIAALLLPAGLQKLMHFSKFAASVASKGLPFPKLWAMLDVAIEVLGPIALIIGLWPRWTALVLVVLTVVIPGRHTGSGCSRRYFVSLSQCN